MLGQSFVIENKAGAGGLIAAQTVARAKPDGYTLLLTTNSTHSAIGLFKSVPYDPIKDFTPIARLGNFPSFVAVRDDFPVKTMAEFVAYAKANPGKLSYGAGNSTGQIVGETLKKRTGIDVVRVAYRSNPTAMTDLLAGHIQLMVPDMTTGMPQVKAGKIRPLAVLTKERQPLLPDVPTLHETVMPEFETLAWAGLFGPAGMPADAVNVLADAIKKMLGIARRQGTLPECRRAGAVPEPAGTGGLREGRTREIQRHDQGSRHRAAVTAVAKLKVLCARSMIEAVNTLTERFARASGHTADITFGTVGALAEKLAAGETADVLILGAPAIAKMAGEGALVAGSDTPIAKTSIGVCVRDGAAAPDISSPDAFRRTLTDARVIALSDPAVGGSAGTYLVGLWQRMGLADEIDRKATLQKSGAEVARRVVEGSADIGLTLIGEIASVKGARVIGKLPPPFGLDTVYAGGVSTTSQEPKAAAAFIAALAHPDAREVWAAAGFEPGA